MSIGPVGPAPKQDKHSPYRQKRPEINRGRKVVQYAVKVSSIRTASYVRSGLELPAIAYRKPARFADTVVPRRCPNLHVAREVDARIPQINLNTDGTFEHRDILVLAHRTNTERQVRTPVQAGRNLQHLAIMAAPVWLSEAIRARKLNPGDSCSSESRCRNPMSAHELQLDGLAERIDANGKSLRIERLGIRPCNKGNPLALVSCSLKDNFRNLFGS